MSEDTCWARLTRREWLTDGPLSGVCGGQSAREKHARYKPTNALLKFLDSL